MVVIYKILNFELFINIKSKILKIKYNFFFYYFFNNFFEQEVKLFSLLIF